MRHKHLARLMFCICFFQGIPFAAAATTLECVTTQVIYPDGQSNNVKMPSVIDTDKQCKTTRSQYICEGKKMVVSVSRSSGMFWWKNQFGTMGSGTCTLSTEPKL